MAELFVKRVELVNDEGSDIANYVFDFGTIDHGRVTADFTIAVKTKGHLADAEQNARTALRKFIDELQVLDH